MTLTLNIGRDTRTSPNALAGWAASLIAVSAALPTDAASVHNLPLPRPTTGVSIFSTFHKVQAGGAIQQSLLVTNSTEIHRAGTWFDSSNPDLFTVNIAIAPKATPQNANPARIVDVALSPNNPGFISGVGNIYRSVTIPSTTLTAGEYVMTFSYSGQAGGKVTLPKMINAQVPFFLSGNDGPLNLRTERFKSPLSSTASLLVTAQDFAEVTLQGSATAAANSFTNVTTLGPGDALSVHTFNRDSRTDNQPPRGFYRALRVP